MGNQVSEIIKVNAIDLKPLLEDCLRNQLVPYVRSSPGIGKSAIAAQIAKEANLVLIDVRLAGCDPVDLNGFPTFIDGVASYTPFDQFPITNTELPKGKNGWLILLDELSSAPKGVQAASYKLILDRMIGNHKLHDQAFVMACGNLMSDNAIVNGLSTTLQSRMIHFELMFNTDAWKQWAISENFDSRILGFLNWKEALIHKFNPNHTDLTYPCPRTWDFLNQLISDYPKDLPISKLPLVTGTIGLAAGRQFMAFMQTFAKLPDIDTILNHPDSIPDSIVSNEASAEIIYALTGVIQAYADKSNISNLMKLVNRMPLEFQVVTMKSMTKAKPALGANTLIMKWCKDNSDELYEV